MKKLLVLMITLCLLMSVCPVGMALPSHEHYNCGATSACDQYGHYHPSDTVYDALSSGSDLYVMSGEMSYYLTGDTTIDTISISGNGQVSLCLNGYTLYHDGISLTDGYPRLHLCDCKGSGKVMPKSGSNAGIDVNAGYLHMYSGTITGHTNTAIRLGGGDEAYPELFVYGGEISGNSGINGGGIAIFANNSIVYITDLVMKNNTATRGGAIYGCDGQVDVYRSIFTGNQAEEGGAIYLKTEYNGLWYDPIMFWMGDVTITNNKTTGGMGGGVAVHGIARLYLGGSTICDNVSDGKACNLYFPAHYFDRDENGWSPLIETSTNKKICIYVGDTVTPDKPLPFLSGYDGPLISGIEEHYFSDQGYFVRYNDEDMELADGELYVPRVPAPPATGDNTPVLLWAAMLLMTAGAAMLLRRRMAK